MKEIKINEIKIDIEQDITDKLSKLGLQKQQVSKRCIQFYGFANTESGKEITIVANTGKNYSVLQLRPVNQNKNELGMNDIKDILSIIEMVCI